MGVPGTGVGSRWLEYLTTKLHASLFSGSTLLRLHFLGLPLELETTILVMEFVHQEEHVRCSNPIRRLIRRAPVTSSTPNIAQSVSMVTLSSSRPPHIHWTIDLSSRRSSCKSGATVAQVSLPCHRAECTQALKTSHMTLLWTP